MTKVHEVPPSSPMKWHCQTTCSSGSKEVFVSGRLCLLGEHSDWAGEHSTPSSGILPGKCLIVGTQEGMHASISRLPHKVLVMTAVDHMGHQYGPQELPLEPEPLLAVARAGGFWSYVAGTAYRLVVMYDISGGLYIDNHTTTLPLSKGLSSSAAVCVLVARAFNQLYDLRLSVRGEMELAYLGEITTPSRCGRMDQGCAYGSVPIQMTFDGDILHVDAVQLAAPLYLVLVDLAASKCTTTILKSLQAHYPTPQGGAGQQLQQLLGPINHSIISRALVAMAAGDAAALGALMTEAQAAFDAAAAPCCPSQLLAPVLHAVLQHEQLQPLVWGGKGVGSQGDGTCQLLCRSAEAQQQVCKVIAEAFPKMHGMPLTVLPTTSTAATDSTSQFSMAVAAKAAAVAVAAAAAAPPRGGRGCYNILAQSHLGGDSFTDSAVEASSVLSS